VFRTNDQGNTWQVISPDLSANIDRNKSKIMGRVWSVDAVAKNQSTDIFGQLTTIAESPKDENILYAGTDDGLIHITSNGGKNWTKISNFAGTPDEPYVNLIIASNHDKNVAYAAINQHRYGDFKPYLFKTTNGGRTWRAIQSNLPARGTVYCVAEDHKNPNLLFAGTEFGVYFSIDGGAKWVQLKGGLPTIAIRDMEIHKRENDLVLATFGRGYYILDDYTSLRTLAVADLNKPAFISPVKTALEYIETTPLGIRGKGFQGESYWNTPNPKPGAVFTYYLKEDFKTLRERRQEAEKERIKAGLPTFYPTIDSLRIEDLQPSPYLLFTVTDNEGNTVRRIKTTAKKGINRISWDFRTDPKGPINFTPFNEENVFSSPEQGIMVLPGEYKVSLSKFEDSIFTQLVAPQSFQVEALNMTQMSAADKLALYAFGKQVSELYRAVEGTNSYREELTNKMKFMKEAALQTPTLNPSVLKDLGTLDRRLNEVNRRLNGDVTLAKREFETPTAIRDRIQGIMGGVISTTVAPTNTFRNSYNDAAQLFTPLLKEIQSIADEVKRIEAILEQGGAPYTPGRLPVWKG
jgi:hypothetical protein